MRQLIETNSNPLFDVGNKYCQHLVEEVYFAYLRTRGATSGSKVFTSSHRAYDFDRDSAMFHHIEDTEANFRLVETISENMCSNVFYGEEHRWNFQDSVAILMKALSSRLYSWSDPNLPRTVFNRIWIYNLLITIFSQFRSIKAPLLAETNLSENLFYKIWIYTLDDQRNSIDLANREASKDTSLDPLEQISQVLFKGISKIGLRIISELSELQENQLSLLYQLPSEALYFCYRQKILKFVPSAINLLQTTFSNLTQQNIQPGKDPETGEEWLELNVTLQGQVNEVLDQYDKYNDLLVTSVPWPERNKIRLTYNII